MEKQTLTRKQAINRAKILVAAGMSVQVYNPKTISGNHNLTPRTTDEEYNRYFWFDTYKETKHLAYLYPRFIPVDIEGKQLQAAFKDWTV